MAAFDTLRNVDPNYNFSKDMGEFFTKTGNLKDLKHNFVKSGINNPDEVPPPNEVDLLVSCYVEPLITNETYGEALEELLSGASNNITDPDFAVLGEDPIGDGINVIKANLNLTPEQVYAGINTNTKLRKMMSNYLMLDYLVLLRL